MNSNQARSIPIVDYLASEGISATHTTDGGRYYWYHSMIREGDNNPSFKVDVQLNTWYDYGALSLFDDQKFRRLPDLVMHHKKVTFSEVLRILEYKNLGNTNLFETFSPPKKSAPFADAKEGLAKQKNKKVTGGGFEIVKTTSLSNPHLIEYLQERGINIDIAKQYVKEIYFKTRLKRANLFAVGFPSGEGFDCRIEKRDFSFKGFIGDDKDIACINMDEGTDNIAVFEGWVDFLSFLTHKNITDFKHSAIIMFSANQRKIALERIRQEKPENVFLFLDHDEAGRDCTDFFKIGLGQGIKVIDRSSVYDGYNDYNDFLT